MNVGLFIAVVIVMMLLVGGVSVYMKLQERRNNQLAANNVDDFATASRSLGVLGLSCTLGLKCLGSGYVLGMPGAGWNYGVGTWWYMAATGAMFVILCAFTGPWVRRFGYTTVNELWGKMFNKKTAVMMSGIAAGTCFGIMTLEIQGVGTIISVLTGWKLAVGCIFAGVVSILYVIFGGMKQIAKLNQINAFIMYAGVLIALFTIGKYLPDGWQGVNEYYLSGDESWKLNIMANAETWRTYIIGMFLAVLFYNTIGPTSLQIISSTKNVNVIRKSIFWMIPMNLMFGACILAFGMAAKSIAEYSAIPGPPIATVTMLMNLLPNWIVVWIFVSFSLAMISTIAMQLLVMPTCFIRDVLAYTKPLKPEKEFSFLRWGVLVTGLYGTLASTLLPSVASAIVWVFAWMLPAFWLFVFGLLWKRSNKAGVWCMIICGIFNMIWSYSNLPALVHLEGNNNSIGLILVSLICCTLFTALDKNAKPPYKGMYIQDKKSVVCPEAYPELFKEEA